MLHTYKGKLIPIGCWPINYRTIEVHQISSQEMPMIPFGNSKALVSYANCHISLKICSSSEGSYEAQIKLPEPVVTYVLVQDK